MNKKWLLVVLLALLALVLTGCGGEKATNAEYFKYIVTADDTITIYAYTGNEMKVVIPGKIDGKKVTCISFSDGSYGIMSSVVIPDGVTEIGEKAFKDCKTLTDIVIPNSVTYIGDQAFNGCENLVSIKAFGIRYNLLQHFFEQHFAERYYSSIPLALMIIDGAVNDYTKSKGFFADGTDVDAWDCIVGCSDALAKVRDIFRKNRTKTNTEPIIMPYRNGILHGRDLNYANEYVACKCLALMFAVSDWMRMKNNEERRKEKFEKDSNPPPISDSLKRYQQIQKDKKEIGEWKRRDVQIGVDIPETGDVSVYSEYPYIMAVVEMLETWKSKNYGSLGEQLSQMFPAHSTAGKRAGACRSLFANKEFQSFRVVSVKEEGCCMSGVEIQVEWTTSSQTYQGNLVFGCVYENEQRNALPWNENGIWKLYPRDVRSLHFPKLKEC